MLQDVIEISFHKLNDNCTCFNCSFRYRLLPTSLFKHAQEKASEVSAKHVVLEVGFASEVSKKNIYIFSRSPPPQVFRFALASSSLPILSRHSTIE